MAAYPFSTTVTIPILDYDNDNRIGIINTPATCTP
jgi:hypothetical protein